MVKVSNINSKPFCLKGHNMANTRRRGNSGMTYCLTCKIDYRRQYKKDHPEKYKIYSKKNNLKKYYNITLDYFNQMLINQNYQCGICSIPIQNNRQCHVDHNHTTGKIRGLLCHHCNTGLGLFKESVTILDKAKEYLYGSQTST